MRPRDRAVSGGEEEGERVAMNNTSLPTPCGQGRSTIWAGGGWLGAPPYHREHLIAPRHQEHGTWLGVAAEYTV